jgi:hypothetical protein
LLLGLYLTRKASPHMFNPSLYRPALIPLESLTKRPSRPASAPETAITVPSKPPSLRVEFDGWTADYETYADPATSRDMFEVALRALSDF